MAETSESGDDVITLNEETQIALPSEKNERRLAVPVVIPKFNLNKGIFDRANFGPQTNTKHVEANTIEHATISHVHHHYGGDDKSQEFLSTSSATGARPRQELGEGFVQITDDIFMNTRKPLKEGIKIYEGYQEHVTGQRQLLAIKAIFPFTKKSIREVQHLVTLAPHPNVVRIIRSKEKQSPLPTLYIAMELCGPKNLHDYLNENREKNIPFDFKRTMTYSKRLVKAMKHIHRNRIIHGDLKPENILFSLEGDQIKISDFGISKELRKSHSSTKMTSPGTDGYRAPETYSLDIISMKADIYSLGFTLYCLWTNGKHPFGPNPYRWVVNIMDNTGRDLSGLPEEMGAKKNEFLDLLDKMLQVDPENRPTITEISKHPFLSSSQATAQASLTMQLSLETSPEEALSELPFVTPTAPESSFTFEETQPGEGREVIMQRSDFDLSPPRLENSPEKPTRRVFASAQASPKRDPDHLHRRASSSDPLDDNPWRKKLRVTNIPKHLSSSKALKLHFERFGKLGEFYRNNKRNFAWITFRSHRDALSAKYGAVSTGPDQNLVIKWDDIEASTRQLSLGTNPEKALLELPFVVPTTRESSLALEETQHKEGREAIMQRPDLDLSPQKNSPKKATRSVLASAKTHPKKDPDHLHRMASSSDHRDDDPWRKRLRVTNIPRHLSSSKALKHHFVRFGKLGEFYRNNKRNFAWITFRNHDDALSAKYGAVSTGPDHNLMIKWDDKEGPGHLHRMASSSDPLDADPWRKKLSVTNIPRHFSSYKALRWHFKRFGQLEECLMNEQKDLACITYHNHDDALTARHGAVSTGPDHNLIIEWDVSEDVYTGATTPHMKSLAILLLLLWLPLLLKKSMLRDIIQLLLPLLVLVLVLRLLKESKLRDKIQAAVLVLLVLVVSVWTGWY